MDLLKSLIVIVLSSVLVNNYVLSRFLGICPFLGVSKKMDTAFGMGMAVTFVMTLFIRLPRCGCVCISSTRCIGSPSRPSTRC